ncbi:MAG: FAD-binding oxidoreductase [Rhizobiaceae bacterium]|nr:FAD-binding oxidoreductase [Rhizobiaceae bacterium]
MIRKLDLRTGRPVWLAYRAPRVASAKLNRDVRADVLVVGMGISGAMAAEALTADGHSVVAIDRRGPMLGSTPATTALVLFEIDQPLSLLSGKISREKARRAWQRSRLALQALRERILDLGIGCDLTDRPSLYLAGNMLDPGGLRAETQVRREAGLSAIYLSPGTLKERFGISRKGAILSPGNLALDPRKLTAGMLAAAARRGARFFSPVEATGFEEGRDEVVVATRDGPTIRAKHVVLATGYELLKSVPGARHRVISTWAIATRPQRRAYPPGEPMIWEASDPYLYLRTTGDGRIVCGGEDEDFADDDRRDALMASKAARLSAKLAALLPGVDATPEFAWSGSFGTTADGLPFAGPVPRHPRLFAAMGYGGNGITWSQLASEIIRTALAGGQDADASLFGFGNRS